MGRVYREKVKGKKQKQTTHKNKQNKDTSPQKKIP